MRVTRKKLIEVALPLPEINDASAYDKMPGIGPHPKGIHQWWARLPLPTARAILFASVVDDPSACPEKWPDDVSQQAERERLFSIMRSLLGKQLHLRPEVYAQAQDEMIRHCDGALPVFFDPFAGGGSIPLEASRLGLEAHASDINPVAVLLNKCNLELAPRWVGRRPVSNSRQVSSSTSAWDGTHGLAADIRAYAELIGQRVQSQIGSLYPTAVLVSEGRRSELPVAAWIWVRTVASPNPAARGRHVPLASTFVLSAKEERFAWIELERDASARDGWSATVQVGSPSPSAQAKARLGTKAGKGQDFICALTDTPIRRSYVQAEGKAGRLGQRLVAIVADGARGRVYLSPDSSHEIHAARPAVDEARATFLAGALPTRAEITGGVCTAYGLNTWGHLFTARQIVGLLAISDAIGSIREDVFRDAVSDGMEESEARLYARTVVTFLSLAADRCADFNNSLCRWSSSNQKVMNLFGKQALPMVFDFAEANLLGKSVGAWSTCSEYVADCVEVLTIPNRGNARSSSAQGDAPTFQHGLTGLLVSTDPPYYVSPRPDPLW